MQKYSELEYDYLKREVAEIKSCITRYIGYIISVSGITGLVSKYLLDSNGFEYDYHPFTLVVVLSSMLLITLLFEVLWYKFRSHNRHVGYIQLISQEVDSKSINKNEVVKEDNIVSWDFVMARYSNVASNNDRFKIHESISKIKYELTSLNTRKLNLIGYNLPKVQEDLMENYYNEAVYPLFNSKIIENKTKRFFSTRWRGIKKMFSNLIFVWFKPTKQILLGDMDKSYVSISWYYPLKLLQIAFVLFIAHSVFFFYLLSLKYETFFAFHLNFPNFCLLIFGIILFRWLWTYIRQSTDLISGKYSIDYYCWLFFIFRVQILNANGIKPKYYSRGYKRYLKTVLILKYIEQLSENEKQEISTEYLDNDEQWKEYLACLNDIKDFEGKYVRLHQYVKDETNKIYKN